MQLKSVTEALLKKKGGFQFPPQTHLLVSGFIAIRVHGRQEVDSCLSHQPNDTPVALFVFFAQVLHEVEDELSTKDLVAVHSCHVAKLWLSCQRERLESMWVNVNMNIRTSDQERSTFGLCVSLLCELDTLMRELDRLSSRHSCKL